MPTVGWDGINLISRAHAFWVNANRIHNAPDEIKNHCAHAFKFKSGFKTCSEKVTAVVNAG